MFIIKLEKLRLQRSKNIVNYDLLRFVILFKYCEYIAHEDNEMQRGRGEWNMRAHNLLELLVDGRIDGDRLVGDEDEALLWVVGESAGCLYFVQGC
jgi:hypothetical protein